MQNLAWLGRWPVKCQGWEGERNSVNFVTLEAGFHHLLEFYIGGSEILNLLLLGRKFEPSQPFEKKEMCMNTLSGIVLVSISRYI